MSRYRTIIRWVFAVAFMAGGVVHLVMGRTAPESYGAFGHTAAWGVLSELWSAFVIPNIAWLTLIFAALEIMAGFGLLLGGRWTRLAVIGILAFFAFLLVLGYGWPTAGALDDFAKNRAGTLLMAALLILILAERTPHPLIGRPQLTLGRRDTSRG